MASLGSSSLPSPNTSISLSGRRIAFTTPAHYGVRLSHLLELRGAIPLPVPTISVGPTSSILSACRSFLLRPLDSFSALAFTSRSGITTFSLALPFPPPLSFSGHPFTVAALGSDAELLHEGNPSLLTKLCTNPSRLRLVVPETSTPSGLVDSLGTGRGRKVLCPIPVVIGLEEPPVVPRFLSDLESAGWVPVSLPAYETRWSGPECASRIVGLEDKLDAIVFTSSAEVEGLLKGLDAIGWSWEKMRERWPNFLVAAHGPVTAKGVETFGLVVDVVSQNFGSFNGVLDALSSRFHDGS